MELSQGTSFSGCTRIIAQRQARVWIAGAQKVFGPRSCEVVRRHEAQSSSRQTGRAPNLSAGRRPSTSLRCAAFRSGCLPALTLLRCVPLRMPACAEIRRCVPLRMHIRAEIRRCVPLRMHIRADIAALRSAQDAYLPTLCAVFHSGCLSALRLNARSDWREKLRASLSSRRFATSRSKDASRLRGPTTHRASAVRVIWLRV